MLAVVSAASVPIVAVVLPSLPMSGVDRVSVSLVVSLLTAFNFLGATTRVVGDSRGWVDMVGLVLIKRVRATAIDVVSTDRALELQTISGQLIRTVAYPSSVAGEVVAYPRSKRVAARIEDFRSRSSASHGNAGAPTDEVTVLFREKALLWALGIASALFGAAVLIELV